MGVTLKLREVPLIIQLHDRTLSQEEVFLLVDQDEVVKLEAREHAVDVKGTKLSYTKYEIMFDKSRCEIPPRAVFIATIFFKRYNADITLPISTSDLVEETKKRYIGATTNGVTTAIGEINKSIQAKLSSPQKAKIIKNAGYGKGYYFDPTTVQ